MEDVSRTRTPTLLWINLRIIYNLEELNSITQLRCVMCSSVSPQEETTDPCDQRELDYEMPGRNMSTAGQAILHELFHILYLLGGKYKPITDIVRHVTGAHALSNPSKYGFPITQMAMRNNVQIHQFQVIWNVYNYAFCQSGHG